MERPPPDAPTVFHLGFAGERQLWPTGARAEQIAIRDARLVKRLAGHFKALRIKLKLPEPHFYVGISQTNAGANLAFAAACEKMDISLRLLCERLDTRLTKNRGQIPYYEEKVRDADQAVKEAKNLFLLCAGLAITAPLIKLITRLMGVELSDVGTLLSWAAIALPVAAVGVMSITSNFDKETRASRYAEMLIFLESKRDLLQNARSEAEFLRPQAKPGRACSARPSTGITGAGSSIRPDPWDKRALL